MTGSDRNPVRNLLSSAVDMPKRLLPAFRSCVQSPVGPSVRQMLSARSIGDRQHDVDTTTHGATDWLSCSQCPVWAREHCRISPPRFLADCRKRQLNQGSFVLMYFRLFTFSDLYWVCLSVFSCTVLFVSISQVIGCEDSLRNDLYCVKWGVKLYSNQPTNRLIQVVPDKGPLNGCMYWFCNRYTKLV